MFKSFTKEINNISTLGTDTTIHMIEIVFIRGRTILHGVCDDLKFDNKFEVPVMYSTAIPGSLLRYT
jgi:hypothetical protein